MVVVFILPRLATLYSSIEVELPFITALIIRLGVIVDEHGYIIVPAVILSVLAIVYLLFINPSTKFMGQWLMFQLGPIRNMIRDSELARFGFVLGSLLDNGIDTLTALKSLADSSNQYMYTKLYVHLQQQISGGQSFGQSFSSFKGINKLFPPTMQQIVMSGEKSGQLGKILLRLGKENEDRLELATKNFATIIEPVLLIIVWIGVATLALAVILPIYSFVGNIDASLGN